MPNRRRRKLSTAMSAVAALAVASPFAVIAASDLMADTHPATEHHDFTQAAMVTDLPNELVTALQQGLSQFGVNLPPLPTGLGSAGGAAPLQTPGLTPPALSPGLTAPGLTPPGLATPAAGAPAALTNPALTNPALTNPALTNPALTNPALTNPGLTSPLGGLNPALTSPAGLTPGLGAPGELPIAAPVPGDPLSGTYPILGDPSLGGGSGLGGGGGGLMSDLTSAASQLGVGQAIDLLKGVVMPMITSAAQSGAAAAPAAAAPVA